MKRRIKFKKYSIVLIDGVVAETSKNLNFDNNTVPSPLGPYVFVFILAYALFISIYLYLPCHLLTAILCFYIV